MDMRVKTLEQPTNHRSSESSAVEGHPGKYRLRKRLGAIVLGFSVLGSACHEPETASPIQAIVETLDTSEPGTEVLILEDKKRPQSTPGIGALALGMEEFGEALYPEYNQRTYDLTEWESLPLEIETLTDELDLTDLSRQILQLGVKTVSIFDSPDNPEYKCHGDAFRTEAAILAA